MSTFTSLQKFVVEHCYTCGMPFGMTEDFQRRCYNDNSIYFYCPKGHSQIYIKSEVQRLKEKTIHLALKAEREEARATRNYNRAEREKRSHASTKGHLTRSKKRTAHGVCPCCTRTFKQLNAHIKNKHPDYWKVNK